jgi:UDPglucose 6-dehydrogenase
VSNPEFLREGFAVTDFMKPDRIVIGASDQRAVKVMESLYKPFVRQGNPLLVMDEKSAELTKYASNAFLATKITFMNEIANFCERVGANVDAVRLGMGADERIGKRFLFPGMGYGGSCFPKDVQALYHSGAMEGFQFQLLDAVMRVNDEQKTILLPKIKTYFQQDLTKKKLAIWGLSFKPDTDDIREAPALYLIQALLDAGASVTVYDPEAMDNVATQFGDRLHYAQNPYQALETMDGLIICTEWSVFRSPDFSVMRKHMNQHVIFDGRNIFEPDEVRAEGFDYFSIGR